MKKIKRFTMMLLSLSFLASSASACGGTLLDDSVPEGRKQIRVSVYAGGFGTAWATNMMNELNESQDKYWFTKIQDNKTSTEQFTTNILSGVVEADIFISDPEVGTLIANNKLLDLTEALDYRSSSDSKTARERSSRIQYYEEYASDENGIYALPVVDSISGVVYDHDLFEMMDWYLKDATTASGLTKGCDGVEGTYDDGLPVTYQEYETLIATIRNVATPLIAYDLNGTSIATIVLESIWAQYEGLENYELSYTYDGTYTSPDGSKEVLLTPETGYKLYSENLMQGYYKGLEFLTESLFNKNNRWSEFQGVSHTNAQGIFLTSHTKQKPIAMIYDGDWWENEAKRAFAEDAAHNGPEYAYGARDFRFMPMPAFEGQSPSSDGKHYFTSHSRISAFALKQNDKDKEDAIIEFFKLLVSEENCQKFTMETSAKMAYDYTLTDDMRANMTPFSRNVFEILSDENTVIVSPYWLEKKNPLKRPPERWGDVKVGSLTSNVFDLVMNRGVSVAEVLQGVTSTYNADTWGELL